MLKISTTPRKIKSLLIVCLVGTIVSLGISFSVYLATKNVVQAVTKDTVPSIVAADHIRASLADAHSNAMNAMTTNEKTGGKFWTLYRTDMTAVHSQLIDASKNITYGDEERGPILTMMSNIGAYEYTVGGAAANDSIVSVDQFMEANRLMQQKILPASIALDKVNFSHFDSIYTGYTKNIDALIFLVYFVGLVLIIVLVGTQYYIFKRTHRIFNIGLLLATILLVSNLLYSTGALNSVKSELHVAKTESFDSIRALWSARAVAYNANALESLYLLHHGTGIVQTADTINFNLSASLLCAIDPKVALTTDKFKGYLGDELSNITFSGELAFATTALQEWAKYVDIDKEIRNLEYDSKHNEAIALCVGENVGQSNYEFAKFDSALSKTIDINQTNFDSSTTSVFKTLAVFPYVTLVFLLLISTACILGLKSRMDEYKV